MLARGTVSLANGFFYADALSALVILLTALVALVCATYSIGYLRDDQQSGELGDDPSGKEQLAQLRMYYTLTPLFVFSMMFMAVANNLGVMWAAIEATTLVSVFLVTFYGKVTSLEAAWKYAIIGGVGLSMALFGTLVAYYAGHRLAGSDALAGLNWSVLAQHAAATRQDLDAAGLRSYSHGLWNQGGPCADAHVEAGCLQRGPGALRRDSLFGDAELRPLRPHPFLHSHQPLLLARSILAACCCSSDCSRWASPFRSSWCRRTIAACWPITPSIMPVSWSRRWDSAARWAALGLMLHMTFHTIAKSLLFLCAGNVQQHFKTDLFSEIKGSVIRVMPLTGVVFLMAMLAIIGMPPFSLFQSEFLIVRAAFDGGHLLTGVLFVLFGTGVFAGALLHVGGMILGPRGDTPVAPRRPWRDGSLLALAAALVVIGFWVPAPLLELIRGAAQVVSGQ